MTSSLVLSVIKHIVIQTWKLSCFIPPPQKKKKKKMCNEYDNFVFDRNINPKNFVDCKYIGQIKNLSTCNKKYISPFST